MCPAAMKLWFNARSRQLDVQTTVAASLSFTAPRNSERIGFLLAATGGVFQVRPSQFPTGTLLLQVQSSGLMPWKPITIAEFGNLITEPWDFIYSTFPQTYTVWELYTPAWAINEVMSK